MVVAFPGMYGLLSLVFALGFVGCFLPILVHAFRASVGTGMLVLCIPMYHLVYAFAEFDHRHKGALVAGWLACGMLAATFRMAALTGSVS